jgi:hypothetical protein
MSGVRRALVGATVALVSLVAVPLATPSASAATAPLVVSGYSTNRVDDDYGIFSSCGDDLRTLLSDTSNFGAGGTVERPISLATPGVDTVTPGSLDGVDVFFTGWVVTGSYTSEERAALLDFVHGGGAVIATTDGTDHDISDLFGVTLADSSYDQATPTALSSPLITGPFGAVSTIGFSGDQGVYSDLGPASEIANADPNLGPAVAVIPPGGLGAGSGPVILVADVDVFTMPGCASNNAGAVANSVFVRNLFAYLASTQAAPAEPTPPPTETPTPPPAAAPVAATPAFTG